MRQPAGHILCQCQKSGQDYETNSVYHRFLASNISGITLYSLAWRRKLIQLLSIDERNVQHSER